MEVEKRIAIEKNIVEKFVSDCLSAGNQISVYDGGEWCVKKSMDKKDIVDHAFSVDECQLRVWDKERFVGSVFLVFGNDGYDVIADSTASPEFDLLLSGANQLSDKYAENSF